MDNQERQLLLNISNLSASIHDKGVLKGLNLRVSYGEVHAIMGPNGSGKSTLSKVLAGHPDYQVTNGSIEFEVNLRMKSLIDMPPEERARHGFFLAYQYPVEIPGVTNRAFLQASFNALCKHQGARQMTNDEFDALLMEKIRILDFDPIFLDRQVNVGFSGGEKKRNEILQMAILKPRLAFLDETDSGLDIDSMRKVADGINRLRSQQNAFVLVTHYQRLLEYVIPDFVHVLFNGRIIKSGDRTLANEIEKRGYDWITGHA